MSEMNAVASLLGRISPAARRWAFWAGVALAVVLALVWLFSSPPVPVDTAAVDRGALAVTIDEEGVARIREVYVVSAPVGGFVQRAPVKVGDSVFAETTVIGSIRPSAPAFLDQRSQRVAEARLRAADAALGYAETSVERAEAEMAFARTELERAEALVARSAVSERSLDEARLSLRVKTVALESARAEVAVKREQRDLAAAELEQPVSASDSASPSCCIPLTAPVDGQVLSLRVESAQVVAAGTPLVEIGDPADLEIVVDLLSSDAVRITEGARASIERWGGDELLAAKVRRIEPTGFEKVSALGIEEQRVQVRLDLDADPDAYARLGHDFRVFVRIDAWRSADAVRVPISALFRTGDDWTVFVDDDGEAVLRRVEIGHRNSAHAEVLGGLEVDERVILHPSDRVSGGASVVERSSLQ